MYLIHLLLPLTDNQGHPHGRELFGAVASGLIKMSIAHRYPLNAAVQAHEDLQARRTTGVSVLVP